MARLTEKQKASIRNLIKAGQTRKQISQKLHIPEGTISHYQNPKKSTGLKIHWFTKEEMATHDTTLRGLVLNNLINWFTKEEMATHDTAIAESAYRKAAICTIENFSVFFKLPIDKALKKFERYAEYLVRTYKLKEE